MLPPYTLTACVSESSPKATSCEALPRVDGLAFSHLCNNVYSCSHTSKSGVPLVSDTLSYLTSDRMHRMNEHELYMRQAIELAANVPEFPFGALIVDRASGRVVSEGWNKSSINPTFHGEIDAINQLVLSNPGIETNKLVMYTTAEPCPMCQGAILWTGIESVVFGTSIRSLQKMGWRQIDILAEEVVRRSPTWRCTITGGVLEQECDALFALAISRRKYSK